MGADAIVAALVALFTQLAPLIQKAMQAKQEEHAAILAEAQAALDQFKTAIAALSPTLAQDDATTDAALQALKDTHRSQ